MKIIGLLLILFVSSGLYAQNYAAEDRIIKAFCDDIKIKTEKHDTLVLKEAFQKHIQPYLDKWESVKADSVNFALYIRIQKDCQEFQKLLERIEPQENPEIVYYDQPRQSGISDTELEEFKNEKYYYYLINYVPTYLIIENDEWFEFFEDNTYSSNKISWDDRNKFTLTFVESNNEMKKALSREGEQYHYEIISKENDWYWIQPLKTYNGKYLNFKLYILVNDAEE